MVKRFLGSIWRALRGIPGFIRRKAFFFGILIGIGSVFASFEFLHQTSTNVFCGLCHIHPESEYSWKRSTHYKNESGMVVNCVDCHLPPMGMYYLAEKTRLGVRDAWGALVKDPAEFDWEAKSVIDHAVTYTYDPSCIRCHTDLYSLNLSPKGVEAHEYYMENTDKLRCINCHITVGHYQEGEVEEFDIYADQETVEVPLYDGDPAEFVNYTETIPGTGVSFNMIAVPGGTFSLGSPESESYREDDEGPQVSVQVSGFWMGEVEVSWQEYEAFYAETSTGERDTARDEELALSSAGMSGYGAIPDSIDAVTGPTPPYGSPDQGWGRGLRPAITMTHHAAVRYCEWLSEKTGRRYRLPTEAEWEYACRGGTDTPYFFEAEPSQLTERKWLNKILGTKDELINPFVWYDRNSSMKSQPGYSNEPNPLGLYNMLGNVREFCLDWYDPDCVRHCIRLQQRNCCRSARAGER